MLHKYLTEALIITCATSAFATPLLPAQRTWIVDRANGNGTDFSDLPPAVAAAASGDTIMVRPGLYNSFRTGKALRILAEPIASILGHIEVTGLPTGSRFVISGLACLSGIKLRSNSGTVHVETMLELSSLTIDRGEISDCSLVTFTDCSLQLGISSVRSTVSVCNSYVTGFSDTTSPPVAFPGIEAVDSLILVSSSLISGNDSEVLCRFCQFDTSASVGVELHRTHFMMDRSSLARGGNPSPRQPGGPLGQSAIVADSLSTIEVDPGAPLLGSLGAPAVVGGRPIVSRSIPGLRANGAAPTGDVSISISAPAGTPAVIGISSVAGQPTLSTLGYLGLGLDSVIIASGLTGSDDMLRATVTVPPLAALFGMPISAQGLAGVASPALTLPGAFVLWL